MSPLVAFIVVFIIMMIALIKFKITPPVALFAASIIFGMLVGMPMTDLLAKLPAGFGSMMTSIGLLIIFGGIFGDMLGESGATEELAKGMVRTFGKKNDLLALNLVGFILSIPIYFGVAYIMTAPLVVALQKISRKPMKSYVISIFTGLLLTHCCVAPTPGPLAVAGQIGANVGWFIIWGLIVCLPASLIAGWGYAELVAKKEGTIDREELKSIINDDELLAPDPNKPSAGLALGLVLLPILLIVIASIYSIFSTEGILYTIISFVGNQNVALFIGMLVTGYVLRDYLPKRDVQSFIDKASNNTGGILLIVGAGGCFSAVLQATTLSNDLVGIMSAANMPMILVGFLLACFIRAAVGTGTGAMLAAVAIVGPACVTTGMSPVIAGLSICLGATAGTFPTDAVFWFPEKYNGIASKDLMKVTTLPHIIAALIGLAILMVMNAMSGVLPGLY